MRNLQIALALVLTLGLSATACTGEMVPLGGGGTAGDDDSGDDDGSNPPPAQNAEATFNASVKSVMVNCAGCHANTGAIGFLGGGGESGYYAALMASGVVDTAAPASSRLLTHTHPVGGGVEFDATQRTAVQAWIEEEAAP